MLKRKMNIKTTKRDVCQTPLYGLLPLIPYLQKAGIRDIWESSAGEGYLAQGLLDAGFNVKMSDPLYRWGENYELVGEYDLGQYDFISNPSGGLHIYTGNADVFGWKDSVDMNRARSAIVTNPPFSLKYSYYRRCYEIGRPFALLMQVDVFGAATAQRLWEKYGMGILLLDKRIDFKMPDKKWAGKGSHFATAWFTWGLFEGIRYGHIQKSRAGGDNFDLIGKPNQDCLKALGYDLDKGETETIPYNEITQETPWDAFTSRLLDD